MSKKIMVNCECNGMEVLCERCGGRGVYPSERKTYGVFIRVDVDAGSEAEAIEIAEKTLETISKPEGFGRWEHYQIEEA